MTKLRIGALLRTRRERLVLGAGAIIVAAALVAGGVLLYQASHQGKQVTAYFTETIGVYPGSTVRVLGVPVGTVDAIQPQGTQVKVTMTVNSGVAVPADAKAVVVAASVVSDRYVQLTPAYTGGPQLTDDAVIPVSRTAVPVEVDQIYTSLNRFAQALGPNGLNKNGALSELVKTGAANLTGNGADLHAMITQFGGAVQDAGRQLGQPVRHDHLPAAVHLDAEGQRRAGAPGRAAARRRVRLPGRRPAGPRRRAEPAGHRARPGAGLHREQPEPASSRTSPSWRRSPRSSPTSGRRWPRR